MLLKIIQWTLIAVGSLIGTLVVAYVIYDNVFYEREMNQIRHALNAMENVEVIDIWGHEDITLEEVSARLSIRDKGEIVLYGLSADAFNYPYRVPVLEIGNYSFISFSCNGGIGPSIDIGSNGRHGHLIDQEFSSVSDVVNNYDVILEALEALKMSPELNHFVTENSESYLLVENMKSKDLDPIFSLLGIEDKFEFAESLIWNNADCYFNKRGQ